MKNMKFDNFCFHNICQHHTSLNQWGCETYGSSLALFIHFNCVQFKLPLFQVMSYGTRYINAPCHGVPGCTPLRVEINHHSRTICWFNDSLK